MREMGGLGTQMPLVRIVMVIGGLALAGIPILNGFWSKELVLEAGHEGGPLWAWLVMLVGAGLTALYTLPIPLDGVLRRAARAARTCTTPGRR